MAITHLRSNEIVDVGPLDAAIAATKTTTLAKTNYLELIRLILPAGKEIPTHKAPGEITVHCLEGRVAFSAEGKTQEITAGQLLYLAAKEPHSLTAIESSSLLVTLLLPKVKTQVPPFDVVQESSEESFPASDSPADHRH